MDNKYILKWFSHLNIQNLNRNTLLRKLETVTKKVINLRLHLEFNKIRNTENFKGIRIFFQFLNNTYTRVNNCRQTCSWMDHIVMSDVLSQSTSC